MEKESIVPPLTTPQITQSNILKKDNRRLKTVIYIFVLLILLAFSIFSFWLWREKVTKDSALTTSTVDTFPASLVLPTDVSEKKISKCGLANEHPYLIDWCEIRILYEWGEDFGYRVSYPNIWTSSIRGANGTNLALEMDEKWMVFVSVAHTDLAVENYDKIEQGYEMSPRTPLIDAVDRIINKEVVMINDKKALKVSTSSENTKYTYYLMDNGLEKDKAVYAIKMHEDISESDVDKILKSFTPEFL